VLSFSICVAKKLRKRFAAPVPDAATSAGTTGPVETSALAFDRLQAFHQACDEGAAAIAQELLTLLLFHVQHPAHLPAGSSGGPLMIFRAPGSGCATCWAEAGPD
jgi:hypothetical protein